ncbi:uncharacterized protein LOC116118620 [Pistacia vera]|uniref:uncharacterized protein LOC116118620 n=1 Tax=Pistacia vera TaxID=55513 RepID=UPI0012630B05|nr:uncharacterized protein LOC116118620 [Pistacia vera]
MPVKAVPRGKGKQVDSKFVNEKARQLYEVAIQRKDKRFIAERGLTTVNADAWSKGRGWDIFLLEPKHLAIEPIEVFELDGEDGFEVAISNHLEKKKAEFALSTDLQETIAALNDSSKLQHQSDLKPLPSYLKYVFLGDGETLPVIISSKLSALQEEKLVQVLKEHKTAIGWKIANIKGISLSTCMHRILLEEGAKPFCQPQRRLNPPMMDVVKKEILKLLEVGVIYPISDSNWVSPIQVVPKKTGITAVKNQNEELVPTCVQNGWQIAIAPEDQERTTFTCSFRTFAYRRMPFGLCNAPAISRHVVSSKGIEVDKAKVDIIQSLPYPTSVWEVRSVLGHAGFYRRFIKDFFKIAPLCKLLQKDVVFELDEACKVAFDKLKELLTSTPIIQPPDWNIPFEIMCDASDYAVGAVLGQRIGKASHAIYDASRILNHAQRNYSTTKKELLAVVFALENFRSY